MIALTSGLAAALAALSAVHILWALGVWWPIPNEAVLARSVVGTPGREKMPGAIPCAIVGTGLGMLAVWLFFPQSIPFVAIGTGLAAAVFTVRGVAAYLPAFQRRTPEPEFRRNDTRLFGPICLLIGAGLWGVAVAG